ncbi:MAG: type II secretion system GspH family protein [Negativicutes bacterium]|nr:type II secretion system GspH family protein [Negativicutes bacterium]
MKEKRGRKSGFTLVEILVVLGILALLCTLAVPRVLATYQEARITKAELDAYQVIAAMERAMLIDELKGISHVLPENGPLDQADFAAYQVEVKDLSLTYILDKSSKPKQIIIKDGETEISRVNFTE